MTGVQLKQRVSKLFGIPQSKIRARAGGQYAEVVLVSEKRKTLFLAEPLVYSHLFPAEFGRVCMGIVYKNSPSLGQQAWGGNIRPVSIAISPRQWEEALAKWETMDSEFQGVLASDPKELVA